MDDYLLNSIQFLKHDVRIDLRPSTYFHKLEGECQSIQIPKLNIVIPIQYHGALILMYVRRPTPNKLHKCYRI